jgi:hypothetical protein
MADGVTLGSPFSVNTTLDDWSRVVPLASNLIGRLWKLALTPGTGGKAQLFNWDLDFIKEPAAVTQWDSYELTLGSKFFKFVKQAWWMYTCASTVTLQLISGTGTYSVTLPAHATRDTERFLLPSVWGTGYDKSKTYRVKLTSASQFKFYDQGSGLEFIVIGGDRHDSYHQASFSELMGMGVGGQ